MSMRVRQRQPIVRSSSRTVLPDRAIGEDHIAGRCSTHGGTLYWITYIRRVCSAPRPRRRRIRRRRMRTRSRRRRRNRRRRRRRQNRSTESVEHVDLHIGRDPDAHVRSSPIKYALISPRLSPPPPPPFGYRLFRPNTHYNMHGAIE